MCEGIPAGKISPPQEQSWAFAALFSHVVPQLLGWLWLRALSCMCCRSLGTVLLVAYGNRSVLTFHPCGACSRVWSPFDMAELVHFGVSQAFGTISGAPDVALLKLVCCEQTSLVVTRFKLFFVCVYNTSFGIKDCSYWYRPSSWPCCAWEELKSKAFWHGGWWPHVTGLVPAQLLIP